MTHGRAGILRRYTHTVTNGCRFADICDCRQRVNLRLPEKDLSQFAWYLQMGSSDQTIGPFAVKTCSAVTVL